MDSIRTYVDAMSSAETAKLRERSAQEQGSLNRATSLIGVSVLAAVILGIAAALKVTRDLSMRLRAEAEARHAKEVAEAASRAKSEFLAMMSHELRTPLNSVIGFSNVLLRNRGGNLSDRDQLYLQRIQAGGKHLLSLIDEVLDLSKIEAGRMKLDPAPVALGELVADTVASFEGQLKERPISLQAVVPDHLSPIITDPAKLLQVLTNLIGNAIKFTEHGTVTVVVVADAASRKPERIEVRDTGIGIPLDRQLAIFDAFEQADTSTAREYGGSGLGLALSKSLCDLMGYQLTVESEVGKGSTFSIVLAPLSGPGRRPDRERSTPESTRVHVAG
jgi:signal transduction histidine kinase